MQRPITNKFDLEVKRIITARNAFHILELTPLTADNEIILAAYENKKALLLENWQHPEAIRAKAELDKAKLELMNDHLRALQVYEYNKLRLQRMKRKELIDKLERRTKELEKCAQYIEMKNVIE